MFAGMALKIGAAFPLSVFLFCTIPFHAVAFHHNLCISDIIATLVPRGPTRDFLKTNIQGEFMLLEFENHGFETTQELKNGRAAG